MKNLLAVTFFIRYNEWSPLFVCPLRAGRPDPGMRIGRVVSEDEDGSSCNVFCCMQ